MSTKATFLVAAAAALLWSSFAEASEQTFMRRMYALRAKYRGHVHIAQMNNKPAVFINTDFGQGDYYSWTSAQQTKFKSFRKDLLKTLGTNTLQLWNPVGGDWLHVGTGTGYNNKLAADNKGKTIKLYSYYGANDFEVPTPGTERTALMVKLKNTQLGKFNTYLEKIKTDFEGTLGETEYNGGVPPYVSGRSTGSHNCTSWMTSWLQKEVGGGLSYGADPPSWCRWTARSDATPLRGVIVFNHPNAPHTGQTVPSNFPLKFE